MVTETIVAVTLISSPSPLYLRRPENDDSYSSTTATPVVSESAQTLQVRKGTAARSQSRRVACRRDWARSADSRVSVRKRTKTAA